MNAIATPYKEYSSSYHTLHRNTILASFLLIIISINGVKLDLEKIAFIKEFPEWLTASIPFIVLVCATYCFFYFLNEWQLQASTEYRKVSDVLNEANDIANTRLEGISTELSRVSELQRAFATRLSDMPPKIERLNDIERRRISDEYRSVALQVASEMQEKLVSRAAITNLVYAGELKATLEFELKSIINNAPFESVSWMNYEDFDNAHKSAAIAVETINTSRVVIEQVEKAINEARGISKRLKSSVRNSARPIANKVYWFGLVPPLVLYVAGVLWFALARAWPIATHWGQALAR